MRRVSSWLAARFERNGYHSRGRKMQNYRWIRHLRMREPGQSRWVGGAMLALFFLVTATGCWAPLHSPAVPANCLPDSYRTPRRSIGPPLNFANLTARPPEDYILGPNDVLEVTISDVFRDSWVRPVRVQIMASGNIELPLIGSVRVAEMNLLEAQQAITRAYADGILKSPRVNVALAEKSTVDIVVLGEVNEPGIVSLPKYQNDVGHALAAAAGLARDAADIIEVHRRISSGPVTEDAASVQMTDLAGRVNLVEYEDNPNDPKKIIRIPLRGLPPGYLSEEDVILHPGDVVVVPDRKQDVFFVVGRLSNTNLIRFTLGDRERELGTGLILPRDRDIDVVTAVAMAGYIDPIDSPTTVTVHRHLPNGESLLIQVDLIAARYERRETIFVEAGDILYLNPDFPWWFRRTFDRIVPDLILLPYQKAIFD